MNAHLLVFDSSQIRRSVVTKIIDRLPEIKNWYAFLDNTICIVTDDDAGMLSDLLHKKLPEIRFIVTEIEPQKKGGWLPKSVWKFMNHPVPSESSDA